MRTRSCWSIHICAALSEQERRMIAERTRARWAEAGAGDALGSRANLAEARVRVDGTRGGLVSGGPRHA
jgi:DNA invertase Pin-like site-specific DNA recombinase